VTQEEFFSIQARPREERGSSANFVTGSSLTRAERGAIESKIQQIRATFTRFVAGF
jgi:hypothetical protein